MSALNSAAQSGLERSGTKQTIQIKLNEQENQVLSNVSQFFGIVPARRGSDPSLLKPFLASTWMAVTELCALVARQAAAILRLLSHLANLSCSVAAPMVIAADVQGGALPTLNLPSLPAATAKPPPRAEPPPAPAAQAPDGSGGDLTLDQVLQLLLAALKIPKPRNQQPTIGGGLDHSTLFRRRQNCAPMTELWMAN